MTDGHHREVRCVMTTAPTLEMNDGKKIPQIGWGVMGIPSADMPAALEDATAAGFRHIDTAMAYRNEDGVGTAISESSIGRDELFVTTKLWNADQGYDTALKAFDTSMELLQLDVLDLYLVHWPIPKFDTYVESWKALEAIQATGRVRSIGVSNFTIEHLQRLFDETSVVPVVNQVELHPRFPQDELRAFHAEHNILTEAWSPLERGRGMLEESGQTDRVSLFEEPVIVALAAAKGKSPAQIVIRWHVQLGNVLIPKSSNAARMHENLDVFDFELSDDDMASMATLSSGRFGPDPAVMNVRDL